MKKVQKKHVNSSVESAWTK